MEQLLTGTSQKRLHYFQTLIIFKQKIIITKAFCWFIDRIDSHDWLLGDQGYLLECELDAAEGIR